MMEMEALRSLSVKLKGPLSMFFRFAVSATSVMVNVALMNGVKPMIPELDLV